MLATPLTANGATNFATQAVRGSGPPPLGFVDVAKTIPTGTAWIVLGGVSVLGNTNTVGPSYTVDISAHPFIVPPLFALTVGVLAPLGTSAKWGISLAWDEQEMVLP